MLHQFLKSAKAEKLSLEGKTILFLWQALFMQQPSGQTDNSAQVRKHFGSIWDTISSKFHHKSSWQKMQHSDIALMPYYYHVFCFGLRKCTIPHQIAAIDHRFFQMFWTFTKIWYCIKSKKKQKKQLSIIIIFWKTL